MRIRDGKKSDPGWKISDLGSGINIPDPQYWLELSSSFCVHLRTGRLPTAPACPARPHPSAESTAETPRRRRFRNPEPRGGGERQGNGGGRTRLQFGELGVVRVRLRLGRQNPWLVVPIFPAKFVCGAG
jgi:hypothetical protein